MIKSKSSTTRRATSPAGKPARQFVARSASKITAVAVCWQWRGRIPLGKLVILAGQEGIGKGVWQAWCAARATLGQLEGDRHGRSVNVLFVCGEDSAADTIKPRLMAAGADLSRVRFLEARNEDDWFSIAEDASELRRLIERHGIQVVFIDPLSDYLGAGTDEWKQRDMRAALHPLRALAGELDVAVVLVMHLNKREEGSFRGRVSGSHAVNAVVRSSLFLSADPAAPDSDSRILTVQKSNLAGQARPLRFRIVGKRVKLSRDLGSVEHPCAVDFEEAEDVESGDVLATSNGSNGAVSKRDLAKRIIATALADGEPHPVAEIKSLCDGIGARTVERAAAELEVEPTHDNEVPPNRFWRLPRSPAVQSRQGGGETGRGETGDSAQMPRNGRGKPPRGRRKIRATSVLPSGGTDSRIKPSPPRRKVAR